MHKFPAYLLEYDLLPVEGCPWKAYEQQWRSGLNDHGRHRPAKVSAIQVSIGLHASRRIIGSFHLGVRHSGGKVPIGPTSFLTTLQRGQSCAIVREEKLA